MKSKSVYWFSPNEVGLLNRVDKHEKEQNKHI